jgi:UDP-N-acetylglucosamine 2-epimerase (non-hydrolysing)
MIRMDVVVGTRPNLVKAAALWSAARKREEVAMRLIHTGQHKDPEMAASLILELDLPQPHIALEGDHTMDEVTSALHQIWAIDRPDVVMVLGDVNATLYAAQAAQKAVLPIAHVEAGLRSFDPRMPEEANRMKVDQLSDILFASEESGVANLKKEGHGAHIFHVGNVMIDTLVASLPRLPKMDWPDGYILWTVHRPSNVDREEDLVAMTDLLKAVHEKYPIVLPLHPRTRKALARFGLLEEWIKMTERGLTLTAPMGYHNFLASMQGAHAVVTDSGGVQEEAYYLNVPCITLRPNTERPSTLVGGGNMLMDKKDITKIMDALSPVQLQQRSWEVPELWDGKAADRIMDTLINQHPALIGAEIKSNTH